MVALPSTIYADAPIIYEGMPLKQSWLADYLQRLMYNKSDAGSVDSGQYSIMKDQITYARHSIFGTDKVVPPVRIEFKGQEVVRICRYIHTA